MSGENALLQTGATMNSTGFSGLAQGPPSVSSQNDRQTDKVIDINVTSN